jgi:uncharacterized protein involved in exopolysaccharide biosynthesis
VSLKRAARDASPALSTSQGVPYHELANPPMHASSPLDASAVGAAGADRDTDAPIRGVFEPPTGFVLSALARNKVLVVLIAIVGAIVGIGYGLSKPPAYTASATLQVGQVNPNSAGFFSYVQSASALATAFSRAIDAEPVLETVQRTLRLAPATAIARLSAEPIPVSPAFRIIATGPSSSAAIRLTNVTANAVISYEGRSNSSNPEASSLLHEYQEASLALQRAGTALSRLDSDKHSSTEARARAQAAKTAAQEKLRAIGNSYVAAVTSQAPRSGLVSLVAGATSATSDRKSKVEMVGFIGLLAGIVAGCLGGVVRERMRRGSLARPSFASEAQTSPS